MNLRSLPLARSFVLLGALAAACAPADLGDTDPDFVELSATKAASTARYGYVSAEFMTVQEVEDALPLLAAHDVDLVWAFPSSATGSELEERFEVVRRGAQLGVDVRPWLLLPQAEGYWPGATNAAAFDTAARKLLDAWLEAGLDPSMLVIDMEAPLDRAQKFIELSGKADAVGLNKFLKGNIDRAQYREATAIYRKLVEHAHELGFRVELSTLSIVLDDYGDGDDALRQGLNIPIDGIAWDLVTFQVYRTLASYGIGVLPSAAYTYDYARRARQRFGDRAAVIVGINYADELTGTHLPTYANPRQAADDVEAARKAGISRAALGLYQLRGIVDHERPEAWFERTNPWLLYLADPATLLARGANFALDAAL
jgi:hypothetical protein